MAKLLGYDFEIIYKSSENRAADALSRVHIEASLLAISGPTWTDLTKVQLEVANDPHFAKILSN